MFLPLMMARIFKQKRKKNQGEKKRKGKEGKREKGKEEKWKDR
jgi:hypothetical protein